MKKKIICFLGFTLYLTLLNILFWSVGTLVVPEYNNYIHSSIGLDSVILIAIHSFIQIFIFRIDRRYSILLMSVLCMLLNLTSMNIGNPESKELYWELFSSIMYSISQFSLLCQMLIDNIASGNILAALLYKGNYYVLFPAYLAISAYLYRLLFNKLLLMHNANHVRTN